MGSVNHRPSVLNNYHWTSCLNHGYRSSCRLATPAVVQHVELGFLGTTYSRPSIQLGETETARHAQFPSWGGAGLHQGVE